MKNKLKIEDIDPEQRWAWAAEINGMGALVDQKSQLMKFVLREGSIFDDKNQVMMDAAENGTIKEPDSALIVVGVRVLGRAWGDAFAALGATGDYLYSISTNYLYDCSDTAEFNKASGEYRQQVLIPARQALKASGKTSGPNRKLDKEMLADIQTRRNAYIPLAKISQDLLDQYGLKVSPATLSRRTTAPIEANGEKK